MDTQKMMDAALELAGLTTMPPDCNIAVPGNNIKKVLMGIDMDTAELLLAKKQGYDCVVSHHPRSANVNMLDVMDSNISRLEKLGIPKNRTQKALAKKKDELSYGRHSSNARRSESAAKLLNMPYISLHDPADLITEVVVQKFLDNKFANKPDTTLGDIVKALEEIGEYKNSARKPVIRVGSADSYAGKIYVTMSGLTGPGADVVKLYFEAGVGTIIDMHISKGEAKEIEEQGIGNVIIAGHMSSDSIGLNIIANKWREMGVDVTMMSGIVGSAI